MSEIQPIIEIESYANVLRLSVETAKKARMFTKDNQQNVLHDSSLDFTESISNGNNILQSFETIKTPKKTANVINER